MKPAVPRVLAFAALALAAGVPRAALANADADYRLTIVDDTSTARTVEAKPADGDPDDKPAKQTHFAIDAGVSTTTRGSLSAGAAVTAALGGSLETSGIRLQADWQSTVGCCVGHPADNLPQGVSLSNSVMLGYEMVGENGSLAVFLGAAFANGTGDAPDPSAPAPLTRSIGAVVSVSGEYQIDEISKISATASYATANGDYFAQVGLGFAVSGEIYLGPQTALVGDRSSQQVRVGVQLTGLKIGAVQFGLSGGYAIDMKKGNGLYVGATSRMVF
jgi:hypothetical protein